MVNINKRSAICILVILFALFATSACTFAMQQNTETPERMISLGERLLLEQNYEQALVQFLRVIEIEPMNPRGYIGAAYAYIGLGHMDEAIAILEIGLERTGSDLIRDMVSVLIAEQELEINSAEELSGVNYSADEDEIASMYIPLLYVPNEVRQIFSEMAVAFRADDRATVEQLMVNEILTDFMRENVEREELTEWRRIKIYDVVYAFFPDSFTHWNVDSSTAVYVGLITDGTGRYIEVHSPGWPGLAYEGAGWTVFDIVNYSATGSYRRTMYNQNRSVFDESYGIVIDWRYEGYVTRLWTRDEELHTNVIFHVDGWPYNAGGVPFYSQPFGIEGSVGQQRREQIRSNIYLPNL